MGLRKKTDVAIGKRSRVHSRPTRKQQHSCQTLGGAQVAEPGRLRAALQLQGEGT